MFSVFMNSLTDELGNTARRQNLPLGQDRGRICP